MKVFALFTGSSIIFRYLLLLCSSRSLLLPPNVASPISLNNNFLFHTVTTGQGDLQQSEFK